MSFLFRNLNLLDPHWEEARGGYDVLVEGDAIKEVSSTPINSSSAQVIDCSKLDGNPLKDVGLFQDGGPNLSVIMKAGKFHKKTL